MDKPEEYKPFLVYVTWTDSFRPSAIWVSEGAIDHTEALCLAVGIVVQWDAVGMTLATCYTDGMYGSTFFIPAGAIRDVRVLEHSAKSKQAVCPYVGPANGGPTSKKIHRGPKTKRPRSRAGLGPKVHANSPARAGS